MLSNKYIKIRLLKSGALQREAGRADLRGEGEKKRRRKRKKKKRNQRYLRGATS
jgi:hypothetical protein